MTDTDTAAATTAAPLPTILDIAHKVATTDGDIAKADAIRLASFILDRQEQIQVHYEHLRMAQPVARAAGEPLRTVERPRGQLTERLAASDPIKQIEGSTADHPATVPVDEPEHTA